MSEIIQDMSDEEIVKAISIHAALAVLFSMIGQQDKARLFAQHAVRLVAAHYAACKRWMDQRKTLPV